MNYFGVTARNFDLSQAVGDFHTDMPWGLSVFGSLRWSSDVCRQGTVLGICALYSCKRMCSWSFKSPFRSILKFRAIHLLNLFQSYNFTIQPKSKWRVIIIYSFYFYSPDMPLARVWLLKDHVLKWTDRRVRLKSCPGFLIITLKMWARPFLLIRSLKPANHQGALEECRRFY